MAKELHRRCVTNRETPSRVAEKIGLEPSQVVGVVKILRACRSIPSDERLAVVAMLDPGLDDEDIGEIFGRSTRWASVVRSQADEIRQEEYIPSQLEWLDDGLQPDYPSPAEIAVAVLDLHASGRFAGVRMPRVEVAALSWSRHAFVPYITG
jgi:hypothetical protein